jgi:hypothetical protein
VAIAQALALQVDYLVTSYDVDAIVESGCCVGDTTAYLAEMDPGLPVVTCDIDPCRVAFTRHRTQMAGNVTAYCGDSAELLPFMLEEFRRPLVLRGDSGAVSASSYRWPQHVLLADAAFTSARELREQLVHELCHQWLYLMEELWALNAQGADLIVLPSGTGDVRS